MACLVLFSTLSFTVEKHYCGRFLVDTAIFSKAKDCGMSVINHSNDTGKEEMKKMSCCKDEITIYEGQNELKMSFDQIDFDTQIFISSFLYSYIDLFSASEKESVFFKEYSPPELVYDILVLQETFLI